MNKQGQYTVTVRGPLPPDIRERLSAVHAKAVAQRRRKMPPK